MAPIATSTLETTSVNKGNAGGVNGSRMTVAANHAQASNSANRQRATDA